MQSWSAAIIRVWVFPTSTPGEGAMSPHTPVSTDPIDDELNQVLHGEHHDPHTVLGVHGSDGGSVIRAFRPSAAAVRVLMPGGRVRGDATTGIRQGCSPSRFWECPTATGSRRSTRTLRPSRSTIRSDSHRPWANLTSTSSARGVIATCGASSEPTTAPTKMSQGRPFRCGHPTPARFG